MTTSRVTAPVIDPANKPKGPVSYFPNIEAKYGEPMQYWIDLTVERFDAGDAHMAIVERLKADHGMGHGHAASIVAFVKSQLAA